MSSKPTPGKKLVPPPAAKVVSASTEAKAVVTPKPVAGVKSVASPKIGKAAMPQSNTAMPFTREHYKLMLIGIGILFVGYVILASGDFVDATKFSLQLFVAPVVLLGGYGFLVYSMLAKPKGGDTTNESN